jgi:Tfp pilus assembly protein PilP
MRTLLLLTVLLAPASDPYSYEPAGRRDPFLRPAAGGKQVHCEGRGLQGLTVERATLVGLLRTPQGRWALLASPEGESFLARAGQRLCDGSVLEVSTHHVQLVQETVDAAGARGEREVSKELRP